MSSDLDRHIFTITEPSLKLDVMVYDSGNEEDPDGKKISRENGSLTPAIRINEVDIEQEDLNSVVIKLSSFVPEIFVSFMDNNNMFRGDSIPRDGDVVSVRIASRQDTVFKDIRMDFDIIRCSASSSADNGQTQQSQPGGLYSITGRLRVPRLLAEESKGYGKKTSLDHLEQIATELELGFATNIDSSDDLMSRFCAYIPKIKFIQEIVNHGYINDDSFVVAKIDPYYYLNYIDLNKIFNSNNNLEIGYFHKLQEDINKNPEDNNNANLIESPLLITNHPRYMSSSQFFENFRIINEAGEKTSRFGYKLKLQYFENDSDEGLVEFDIEPKASNRLADAEEPLRGRRQDETRYKEEVKQKYVGRLDVDKTHGNTHINHYFASIQNKINYAQSTKMKLEVILDSFNPSIYLYMKIPVFIVAYNTSEVARLRSLKDSMKNKGLKTVGEEYGEDPNSEGGDKIAMDEFHTGYYIVENIEYLYDSQDGLGIRQKLTLMRREWPTKINHVN
jgi:hypothetical protein